MAGIYVHIPFRRSRRLYDGAYYVAAPSSNARSFTDALLSEIEDCRSHAGAEPITTAYIGGGRPELLPVMSLQSTVRSLLSAAGTSPVEEATIEFGPDDRFRDALPQLVQAGISRVSLEVLSFVNRELHALEAPHSAEQCVDAVEHLRSSQLSSFSVDLAFGAPGQTLAGWKSSLQTAVDLRTPHVTIREITDRDANGIDEPDPADCLAFVMAFLRAKGYEQYELTHFARPGHASDHQRNYYAHGNYLAFGPSAQSFWWTDRSEPASARRWSNVADVAEYVDRLKRGESPTERCDELDRTTLAREYILLRLRTEEGLDLDALATRYGVDLRSEHGTLLDRLATEGLIFIEGSALCLTDRGRLVTDAITERLLPA